MRRTLVLLTVLAGVSLSLIGAWRIGDAGGEAPASSKTNEAPTAAVERIESDGVPALLTSPGPEAERIEQVRECDPTGTDCQTGTEIRPSAEQMAVWKAHTDEVLAACGKLPDDQQLACLNADTGWFPPGIAGDGEIVPTPERMGQADETLAALTACGVLPEEERTPCVANVWSRNGSTG